MKIKTDINGASLYRLNPVPVKWYRRKNGKNSNQQGKTWSVSSLTVLMCPYLYRNKNVFEVYPLTAKNNSKTYWLVEHRIIPGTGKVGWPGMPGMSGLVGIIGKAGSAGRVGMVGSLERLECIVLYQVELVKQAADNKEYWIVKRLNEKKLL